MKISPINYNRCYLNQSFASTRRTTYKDSSGRIYTAPYLDSLTSLANSKKDKEGVIVSNYTTFFRNDFPWDNISDVLFESFPFDNVNIYNYACSDGSEAYSLAISLIENLGEKEAKRFLPIKASDIDKEVIEFANSRKILATLDDMRKISNHIKDKKIGKYFDFEKNGCTTWILSPKKILTDNVIFECCDISEGLKNIDKNENNVILCRNFWKYLSTDKIAYNSRELKKIANTNSKIIIGDFDRDYEENIPYFFKKLGFEEENPNNKRYRNILKINNNKTNSECFYSTLDWLKYIISNYEDFVPSMDE